MANTERSLFKRGTPQDVSIGLVVGVDLLFSGAILIGLARGMKELAAG
jgi:hypothetical protein